MIIVRFSIIVAALSSWSVSVCAAVTPLSLPKAWSALSGSDAYTDALGCSQNGLGSDYAAEPLLKFDGTGDYLIIQLADAPDSLSYKIKGYSFSDGTFTVQQSADGSSYTTLASYTSFSGTQTEKHKLSASTRYIKFIYTSKSSGNVALGTISITKGASYNVNWYVGNDITKTESSVYSSTPPAVSDNALGGYCASLKFVGWSATNIGSTPTVAPADLFIGTKALAANSNFYAVFAEEVSAADTTVIFSDNMNISGISAVSSRDNWDSFNYAYGGDGSIRLSTTDNLGMMKTDALSSLTSASTNISFKIKAWGESENGQVSLTASTGTISPSSVTATTTSFTEASATITGGAATTKISFTGIKKKRIYIKDISIARITPAVYANYRTTCSTCPAVAPEKGSVSGAATVPLKWVDSETTGTYNLYINSSSSTPATTAVPTIARRTTSSGLGLSSTTYTYNYDASSLSAGTYYWWVQTVCTSTPDSSSYAQAATVAHRSFEVVAVDYQKNASDATGSAPSTQKAVVGGSITTQSNTFTRSGYSFSGWNTAANGSGTSKSAGESYSPTASTTFYAHWDTVAPSSLSVAAANGYDFCAGQTITLTVSGSNISSTATYQWKLNGVNISGATSATYTKASCTSDDAGVYTCEVNNGKVAGGSYATSSGTSTDIKVFTIYLDDGTGSNFAHHALTYTSNDTGKVLIDLNASTTYHFKVYDNHTNESGHWFGNNGTMTSSDCTNWTFSTSGGNCGLTTTVGGTYTFRVCYSNATSPVVSVAYATANQAAGKTIYFDNSVLNWSNLYYRIGKSDHNQNATLTLVTGTDKFYKFTTTAYDNMSAWHIANNYGWAGSGNSIFRTTTNAEQASIAITNSIAFQQYAVVENITIVPTSTHSTGGDDQNSNCEFYTVTKSSGMLSHTATITAPSHGTITLAYTDVSGTSREATTTTAGLAHRTKLTATATAATGYQLSTFSVTPSGGVASSLVATNGNAENHILAADATFAATFTAQTYTVTLAQTNATTNSSPTSVTVTYDANTNLTSAITIPQRTDYTFGGYFVDVDDEDTQLIDAEGNWIASVSGYTDASKRWIYAGAVTLNPKWTLNPVATPTISPSTGTMLKDGSNTVTLSCGTDGASIYYTTDGSTPTSSSTLYSSAFTLEAAATVKAIAIKDGRPDSEVATATYTYGAVFTLATSSTTFEDGDEIVIMNTGDTGAMKTTGASNGMRDTTKTGFSLVSSNLSVLYGSAVQRVVLESYNEHWLLDAGDNNYFYLKSAGTNLYTSTDITSSSEWTISVNASSVATITSVSSSTYKLRYNSSSPRFTTYGGSQQDLHIYRYHRTTPYIRTAPSALTTFTYAVGYGPSLAQALTIKGYNLTGNLTVACPTGYELSSTSALSGFSSSNLTLTKDGSNKVNTTVYIRLAAGKSTGSYNQTLTISGGGITAKNFSLTGSVVAAPSGTAYTLVTDEDSIFPDDEVVIMNEGGTHVLSKYNNGTYSTASYTTGNFTVVGNSVFVTGDSVQNITIGGVDDKWRFGVGDSKYLYSGTGSNVLNSSTWTYAKTNGQWNISINNLTGVATVKSNLTETSSSNRNLLLYNTGSPNRFACYYTMQNASPKLYAKPSLTPNVCGAPDSLLSFSTTYGTASAAKSFSVKARNISTGSVTITAPTGYEVSKTSSTTGFDDSQTLSPTDGTVAPTTMWVRLKAGIDAGAKAGNISVTASGATTRYIALTGTVDKISPSLSFAGDVNEDGELEMTLTGSSVTSEKVVFSTLSDGAFTVTVLDGYDVETDNLTLNTSTKKFTATAAEDVYTVTLAQAASTNYTAAELEFVVNVYCGTPDEPENITVSDTTVTTATISWDAVDGAATYAITITGKTGGGDEDFAGIDVDDLDEPTYTAEGLSPNCTYECVVSVTNTCGEEATADEIEFTTLCKVTYHAVGEDNHVVTDIYHGASLAKYQPVGTCTDKRFMYWAAAEETTLREEASKPASVTADGSLSTVTTNHDLYAVYAVKNGGKYVGTHSQIFNEGWGVGTGYTFNTTTKTISTNNSCWITDVASNPYGSWSSGTYTGVRFEVKDQQHYIRSANRFSDIDSLRIQGHGSANIGFVVYISADNSSWTRVDSLTFGSTVATKSVKLPNAGDYYVKIVMGPYVGGAQSSYKASICSIQAFRADRTWWYSDYSTTCSTPASATLTFSDGGSIASSGAKTTLPFTYSIDSTALTNTVPTKSGYLFDHYTIGGTNYGRCEEYVLGHDVTATTTWTAMAPELDATDIYVTSAKDILTQSSMTLSVTSPFHTSGTLAISNQTGGQGGTFAAEITGATAASSGLDATVKINYTPTKKGITETATMTATINGQSTNFTVHGRSLPDTFVVAVNTGSSTWIALPADKTVSGSQDGYSITVDNGSDPDSALLAPEAAAYKFYVRSGVDDKTYVRLAALDDNKTLWSSTSNGIRNYATIGGGSATGAQYNWRLATTDNETYTLYNTAAGSGAGRYLGINSDNKWGVNAVGNTKSNTLRLLPLRTTVEHIAMTVSEWGETSFTFTTSDVIPAYDAINVVYNSTDFTATMSGASSPYTISIPTIDLSAASGSSLTVQWKNGGTVVAFGSVITPVFITAANATDEAFAAYDADVLATLDVHVNGTISLSSNLTVHDVTVAPGGSLNIGGSATLRVTHLNLQGGWNSDKSGYDVPRLYIASTATLNKTNNLVNYDLSIDKQNYYPLAVPYPVAVKDIDYADPTLAAASTYGRHYVIKYYDGARRAENGNSADNWVTMGNATTDSLRPGVGYIITAVPVGGKAIIRIPLTFVNGWTANGEQGTYNGVTKNVTAVTAHTGTAANAEGIAGTRHKGWNMLGVPFMSCYSGSDDMYDGEGAAGLIEGSIVVGDGGSESYSGSVPYVSVPSHDFAEYIQTDITQASLLPGWCFFVQIGTTGNLTYLTSEQAQNMGEQEWYAPQRDKTKERISRLPIKLSGANASDKTTLIVSDRYSSDYEIGADLEKLFGNAYTLATYTLSGDVRLVYNAMSEEDARDLIPVGVRLPEQGEYCFSLAAEDMDEQFERIDLIDYETGTLTNLLYSDYHFIAAHQQTDDRFALNAVLRPVQNTPTDVTPPLDSSGADIEKLIIRDKLYILTPTGIYDATGIRVLNNGQAGKEGVR